MSDEVRADEVKPSGSPAKSMFLGEIVEELIFPFPVFREEERETLQMVIDSIDKFMEGRDEEYRSHDRSGDQPEDYIESLKELGLFGLIIPEEFGGIGLSNSGYSRVLQQTSRYDGSTSLTVGAHSSIGMKGLLLFGTPEQKHKYLPKLASGEMIAAFCLTEAGAGSDAGSIKTTAVRNADGSWTLNGEKIWITNGGTAGFYTVFARTDSDQGKISALIVEAAWPGVTHGAKEDKMGIRASCTTSVRFENVRVPAEALLGSEGMGFKVAMSILNNGRTGLGGGCIGAIKRCLTLAIRQSKDRKQFGKSVAEFELVQEKLAQMTVQCFAAESVVATVGHLIDSGQKDYSVEAAISKIFSSEALWSAANEALQIAGGNGFMRHFPYEQIVRDSRINMIFEGTNEILRLYVALSGLKDAGEYLKGIGKGVGNFFNDPIKGFGVLSGFAGHKLSQMTALGRDRLNQCHSELREEATIVEVYVQRLSKATETILRKLGKEAVNQQFQLKRLADVAIDLFVSCCVLSRVTSFLEQKGSAGARQEVKIAQLFVQQAKRRMNRNLRALVNNEDENVREIARHLLNAGEYEWDLI
jgi:alkylation response protein AidB-like acyl-CoA dehydrogenase